MTLLPKNPCKSLIIPQGIAMSETQYRSGSMGHNIEDSIPTSKITIPIFFALSNFLSLVTMNNNSSPQLGQISIRFSWKPGGSLKKSLIFLLSDLDVYKSGYMINFIVPLSCIFFPLKNLVGLFGLTYL